MLWVTRPRLHLDRVASPWLVSRFVDGNATFGFVDPDQGESIPEGAIGLTLPGVELGPLDENGATFRKILKKYNLTDPALARLADIVEAGIAYSLRKDLPELSDDVRAYAVTIAELSEGLAVRFPDDHDNLKNSFPIYDALYISLWSVYGEDAPEFNVHPRKRIDELQEVRDWPAFFSRTSLKV